MGIKYESWVCAPSCLLLNPALLINNTYIFILTKSPHESERVKKEIWAALNSEVLRADKGEVRRVWSSAGMKGQGKREIPEKTHRPAASSSTIPTCEYPEVTRPATEHGSPWYMMFTASRCRMAKGDPGTFSTRPHSLYAQGADLACSLDVGKSSFEILSGGSLLCGTFGGLARRRSPYRGGRVSKKTHRDRKDRCHTSPAIDDCRHTSRIRIYGLELRDISLFEQYGDFSVTILPAIRLSSPLLFPTLSAFSSVPANLPFRPLLACLPHWPRKSLIPTRCIPPPTTLSGAFALKTHSLYKRPATTEATRRQETRKKLATSIVDNGRRSTISLADINPLFTPPPPPAINPREVTTLVWDEVERSSGEEGNHVPSVRLLAVTRSARSWHFSHPPWPELTRGQWSTKNSRVRPRGGGMAISGKRRPGVCHVKYFTPAPSPCEDNDGGCTICSYTTPSLYTRTTPKEAEKY
ncbi:hypothetical protein PR048_031011 [Dryococelus australis]|uniref:Uncharacterized protein n=1 Tax=Dryococelus australis TaxID=614101 RepID=A0ABQ9G418_9NEOP|nr:hypothetical protein PR048_031011 [Dryococelus australis]